MASFDLKNLYYERPSVRSMYWSNFLQSAINSGVQTSTFKSKEQVQMVRMKFREDGEDQREAGSPLPAFVIFFLILFFCLFCGSANHKPTVPLLSPITYDASVTDASLICIED